MYIYVEKGNLLFKFENIISFNHKKYYKNLFPSNFEPN